MPIIKVAKPFNLLLSPTAPKQHFDAGEHDVTDEVAEHWYTKEHLEKDIEDEPAEQDTTGDDASAEAEADEDALEGSEGDDTLQATDVTDEVAEEFDPALLDAMNDDELRAFIAAQADKPAHHNAGHDKLLAQAKELAGVQAEA